MRHKVYGKHLSRDKNQRTALFRGLIRSLILQESITTTEAKTKAIKGLIDRIITKSKDSSNASQRVLESILPQKEVREKLLKDIVPGVKNRTSGFTQTVRLGRRLGDGAMMVKMSIISEKQKTNESAEEKKIEKKTVRKTTAKKETKK